MNSVGGTEILLILIIAAIVFGPKKMANFAKNAGRFIRKMRHLCVPSEDSAHAYASNGIRNAIWYIQKEAVLDLIHMLQSTNANEIFETMYYRV